MLQYIQVQITQTDCCDIYSYGINRAFVGYNEEWYKMHGICIKILSFTFAWKPRAFKLRCSLFGPRLNKEVPQINSAHFHNESWRIDSWQYQPHNS